MELQVNKQDTISVMEMKVPGADKISSEYPLVMNPQMALTYFMKREKFNLFRMLMANPSMLMMGVMGLMVKNILLNYIMIINTFITIAFCDAQDDGRNGSRRNEKSTRRNGKKSRS